LELGILLRMALDIGLSDEKTITPYPIMSLEFEDDGYYWFCFPFFEQLRGVTGQMIDLYGGAWFFGPQLDDLIRSLEMIAIRARTKPLEWQEQIGHSVGSVISPTSPQPTYQTVNRNLLLERLEKFCALSREAKANRRWVACLGD
jgi:hypothetical protein